MYIYVKKEKIQPLLTCSCSSSQPVIVR